MQAIKALVIGMGILLIAGVALLGYGTYKKVTEPATGVEEPELPTVAFGTVNVPVAAGARVVDMRPVGARLAVLVEEGGVARILLLDARNGAMAGEFLFVPRP